MPPNTIEAIIPYTEPKIISVPVEQTKPPVKKNNEWYICQTILNMIGRLSVGIVVGVCITFAFRSGVPLNVTNVHIVLCVIGVSTKFIFLISYNNCNKNDKENVAFSLKLIQHSIVSFLS